MAFDRQGNPIEVGSVVYIPCNVVDVVNHHGEDRSTLTLETHHDDVGGSPNRFEVQGSQVLTAVPNPFPGISHGYGGGAGSDGAALGNINDGVAGTSSGAGDGGEPVKS